MKRTVAAGLLAVLVVAAGCVGGIGAGTASPASDGASDDGAGAGDGSADGASVAESGTVNFYVSDRPNDMDDFEHLNVTITAVRFHFVDPADGDEIGDETATATATETATATATPSPTATATATATETATATATETATATAVVENDAENDADAADREEADGEGERDDDGEDGRWVVREINATTVDLTELQGANATLVERFDLPAGEYNQVVLEVSETNGTLTDGNSTNVKLPSERLKLNQKFTVGNGEEVDFVYDVTVHKAGKSGKYILRPVASESGTEVPIERVDDEDDENQLQVRFTGSPSPGENATVRVTRQGSAVANATVSVDGAADGTTNADGEYTFAVPGDAEEIEVEVADDDAEGELEREFGGDDGPRGDDADDETDDGERGQGQEDGNGPPDS